MESETIISKTITLQQLPISPSDVKGSDQIPSLQDAGSHFPQTELNSVDEPVALQQTSPDTTTPSSSGNISDQDQGKVFAEVVEAAKAGDLAKIINLVSSLTESSPPSMNPSTAQAASSSAAIPNNSGELALPNLPESINAVIQSAVNSPQTAMVSTTTSSDAPAITTSSSNDIGTPVASSSATPPRSHQGPPPSSPLVEEPKALPTSSGEEKLTDCKSGNPQPVNELTGPPLSEPAVTPSSIALPTTVWGTSTALPPKPVCVTPTNLSTDINVQLTVLNAAGELSPVHLCLPEHPLIILRVNPIPGARVGQLVTLSFSAQMILKTISSILENGAVYNGAPIIIPISTAPPPPAPTSAPSTESVSKAIALPAPPSLPLGMKSAALSGARKMRAIAPKPSSSAAGSMPVSSVATAAMRSASVNRPARKLFAAPVAPNPLTLPNSSSTIAPASAPIVNPTPLVSSNNARSASILRKVNSNSPNSRNRNRRKNLSTTLPPPPPVTMAVPTTTSIVPQSTGYIVDPTSGALISTDTSTVSGGFIQSIMQPGPNGPQFFAPTGSILVGPSNNIIPMPISGVIPAESKPPDTETVDLITNAGNPYPSGFLVPADGSNDGFSRQVFFTNGGAPNGQFLLPSYQTSATGGEYVQSFSAQQAEYLQTNGGEIYFTSDGSCYMPYTGIIGQPQPVATVDIKDDGSGVDVVPETDDIIDIAMRVAREDVDCSVAVATAPVATESVSTAPGTIELTDDANGVISEFIQSSAVPPLPSSSTEFEEHQTIDHVSPVIDESVSAADQQTSTGDAKIDALLAEAALVSSVNGVGDNQSAVSVPVTSLLGPRASVPTTTVAVSNAEACTIVEANAVDMNEFPQSLYDSFANFEAAMIPEPVPTSSTEAATEAAFTYVTQKVGDLDAEFGTTDSDLDVTSTHVTESFLKSLVNQADDLEAEMASKEARKVTEPLESQKESDGASQNDAGGITSQAEMTDLFQLPFSRSVDDDVAGGDSDDNFFPFSRDYTTPEQFDAALQLLDSQPSSDCTPPHIPDDVDDADDEDVNGAYCDDAPIVPDSLSVNDQEVISREKPSSPESKHIDEVSFGESLLPPELTLHSNILDSSPAADTLIDEASTHEKEQDGMPSPCSTSDATDVRETVPIVSANAYVEEEDDDSGSELDFLPSRKRPERNVTPPTSPKKLQSSSPAPSYSQQKEPPQGVDDISGSPHPVPSTTTSPIPATASRRPLRLPRQSTPRVRFSRRKSVSSAISPSLRRSSRRGRGGTSSTPVSPRQLRSSTAKRKEDTIDVSEEETSDDILPLKNTISKDLSELDQALCPNQSQEDSATFPMLGNDVANSSRLTLDSTLPRNPCVEESSILCNAGSPQSPKKKRIKTGGESTMSTVSNTLTVKGGYPEEGSASVVWDLNGSRPTSFGLSNTSAVPSLIPVNNFESHLELRDNPVLQSDRPFWSDPNGPASTEDDDDDEEGGERERVEVGDPDDDSESDSSPSLLATIRAASLALNLPFSPPIALPGNETAFTQFASSISLPSFDAFVPSEVSNEDNKHTRPDSTAAAVGCTARDGDEDADDDGDDDEAEDVAPSSWIPDPTKLVFSENLFPPKFSPLRILRPPSVPILHDKVLSSFSAIAEAAPEKEGFATNPTVNIPRQKNCRPICQRYDLSLYERTQEMVTVSSQEEVTVDESLPGTRHLPIQCEVVPDLRLVSPVAKFMGASTVDPPPVAPRPSSSPSVQIIDLPTPSSTEAVSSSSDCAVEIQDSASMAQPPIRLKFKLSDIRLRHKKANRKRKVEQESTPQQQHQLPLDIEASSPPKTRKIGTILRFSRVGGTFRTETVAAPQSSPNRTSPPPQLQPPLPPIQSTTTIGGPAPPVQPIWAAAKPPKRGRRGTGGRGGRGRGSFRADRGVTAATAPTVCCHGDDNNGRGEASVDLQQSFASGSKTVAPTLSKKFFSSSKEDRRSSAIRTVRPWRSTFGNLIRKRGRFCGTADRTGSLRNGVPNQPSLPPVTPSQPQKPPPPSTQSNPASSPNDPIRLVIRLSKEKDSSAEAGQALANCQANDGQLQETEESTTVTSNEGGTCDDGVEDEEEGLDEEDGNEVGRAPTGEPGQQFFVAPEAETFIDKNQARVRVVLNKALYTANGVDPHGDDDDDEDDEEEEGDSSFFPSTHERLRRLPPVKSTQPAVQRPTVSTEQHYRSHQTPQPGSRPPSYASQQPPPTSIYNHQPTTGPPVSSSSGTTVFSPLRCDMTTAPTSMQQARSQTEAVSSARSSSTASGSLPAPSTISPPAPFTVAATTSEAESNGGPGGPPAQDHHQSVAVDQQQQQQHFYQRQLPRQFGEPDEGEQGSGQRSYVLPKLENTSQPPTPATSAYPQEVQFARQLRDFPTIPAQQHHHHQQQHQQALAAACAAAAAAYVGNFEPATMQAMWASSFLNNLSGAPSGYAQSQHPPVSSSNSYNHQQHDQQHPSRGNLEPSHQHQQQQQQLQQQPVFPPYRGEGDASRGRTNEAHQQPPYSVPSHFTNRVVPDSGALNYYWHSQQYQQFQQQSHNATQLRAIDRAASYYSAASPALQQQQQHQASTSHPNAGLTSQWYQSSGGGVPSSASQSSPAAPQAASSTPGYSQIDDSAVVAAVAAAGYRLPPFSRLS
ncbi:hypothetical protein ECG_03661 [Echinococcus granulosus]|uniref:Expressed conserved protein n=1 Tax=Echinococcus granulosus TaxID=6210 RepID=A0A068X2H3_ECHGR|nr:hypothetical protein ECG_03661 [Echinococcus granulosus]CDS24183.1 hypothetical protein EgrG_000726000 [Echinococcus granulosus]